MPRKLNMKEHKSLNLKKSDEAKDLLKRCREYKDDLIKRHNEFKDIEPYLQAELQINSKDAILKLQKAILKRDVTTMAVEKQIEAYRKMVEADKTLGNRPDTAIQVNNTLEISAEQALEILKNSTGKMTNGDFGKSN